MPDKRGVFRDDDERAAVGAEHRRERARSHPAISGELDTTAPPEASDEPSPDEVTGPIDLARRDLTLEELGLLVEIGGDPDQPGALGLLVKTVTRVNAVKREERKGNQARANEHLELTGDGTLVARVSRIETLIKRLMALAVSAVVAAAGSLITVGKGLYERGEREGGDAIRLQTLERDATQLRLDLRDLRLQVDRHNDRSGWLTPPTAPRKDPP